MKHEWRKKEKALYLPGTNPEFKDIPEFQFLSIRGEGNPNSKGFTDYITALYSVSYAIKMTLKKLNKTIDYTVYPLEGVWDINEEAKKTYTGRKINKDDLVFKLMIRQPDFVSTNFYQEMLDLTKKKKPQPLLDQLNFEKITEGPCIQMLHIGSYDTEDVTFKIMETYAESKQLKRLSKVHREVYLSDFRKVAPEKLKTLLRFKVQKK